MKPFPAHGTPDEITRWWIEQQGDHISRGIAAGQNARPITTWAQVAAFVDDATWSRILGDLAPASRTEALAARPDPNQPTQRHLAVVPDREDNPR